MFRSEPFWVKLRIVSRIMIVRRDQFGVLPNNFEFNLH